MVPKCYPCVAPGANHPKMEELHAVVSDGEKTQEMESEAQETQERDSEGLEVCWKSEYKKGPRVPGRMSCSRNHLSHCL